MMFELANQIVTFAASAATVVLALLSLYKLIHSLLRRTALKHLFDALKNGKSIASQTEVNYQVKCYVPPTFLRDGRACTVKQLLKEIKKPSGLFAVTGKPGSGKTTAMRYLYCRLSRTRKCIYVQMQTVQSIEDLTLRIKEQMEPKWKEHEPVIAFFDGVDEAISFHLDPSTSAVDTFCSMFLRGGSSGIYQLAASCGLNLDCVVVSLRLEFLDSPDYLRKCSRQNLEMQVCRLEKLSDQDVIKVFKSLKVLQRMDKSNWKQRHGERYPSMGEERKYIKLLRRILKDNPDSIFYYPMFVRYAYAFMKEYEQDLDNQDLTPASNMAKSFKVLLRAALKWEFHIYYGAQASSSQDKETGFQAFEKAINRCMDQVIRVMLEQEKEKNENPWAVSRQTLEGILEHCAYSGKDKLVIAHCILVSDDDGVNFGFFHYTFYEFYLAKYLLLRGDYWERKARLTGSDSSKNLRQMYYAALCDEAGLCGKLSASITDLGRETLSVGNCIKLQLNPNIHVSDEPELLMVEILSYLPFAQNLLYRGAWFSLEEVEGMMSGTLNLERTGWESLDYAGALAPAQSIKTLKLRGMPLSDVQGLGGYRNLSSLDISLDAAHEPAVYSALEILRGMPLKELRVYTQDGQICVDIQERMEQGALSCGVVMLDVLEYSGAYAVIYQLKQRITGSGGVFQFRVSCASPKRAFEEYCKNDSLKDLQVLTAVFELEFDQLMGLGQQAGGSNTETVLWDGLNLAHFYKFQDSIDEDAKEYQIYQRLEPYMPADGGGDGQPSAETDATAQDGGSKVGAYFGRDYGRRLILAYENQSARKRLAYAYRYADKFFSEEEAIDIGISLYKSRVRCKETNLDEFREALRQRITQTPSFEGNRDYLWFLRMYCADLLRRWEKGGTPPEELDSLSRMVLEKTRSYVEGTTDKSALFSAVYLRLIFENRMEHVEDAAALLDELAGLAPAADETGGDRHAQARWIQYMEQRLYYLFLTRRREETIETANELMAYPYRQGDLWKDAYQRIIDWCAQDGGEEDPSVDRHELWSCFWY